MKPERSPAVAIVVFIGDLLPSTPLHVNKHACRRLHSNSVHYSELWRHTWQECVGRTLPVAQVLPGLLAAVHVFFLCIMEVGRAQNRQFDQVLNCRCADSQCEQQHHRNMVLAEVELAEHCQVRYCAYLCVFVALFGIMSRMSCVLHLMAADG
jgi:hypothetical protein